MKVIASDYDGTLNQNRIVSKEDMDAIHRWRQAGNRFGVITGRNLQGILHEMHYYSCPFDFLICNNGCVLYNEKAELLEDRAGDGAVLPDLCGFLIEQKGLHVAVTGTEGRCCVEYEGQVPGEGGPWIPLSKTAQIQRFTQVDTHFHTEEEASALAAAVNERFHGRVTAFQNGGNVDIVPFGVSKAGGLTRYLELMKIPASQAVTVGDNLNDLDMLLAFGGYAIASGRPEVAKQAGKTCKNVADLVDILARGD